MRPGKRDFETGLTQARLKQVLDYDPETGLFVSRITRRKARAGTVYGSGDEKDYVFIGIDYEVYLGHRLAWLYMTGEWPKERIDHKNRVRSDNRWSNLREADDAQNAWNTKRLSKEGYRGVYRSFNRYYAKLQCRGTRYKSKSFATAIEAAAAYDDLARKYHHPDFAILNGVKR